jgi:hypothetical protein
LATPYFYSSPDPQKEIVDPAIKGVVCVLIIFSTTYLFRSILEAALKTPTMKRVVQTSSGAAMYGTPVNGHHYTEKDWNTTSSLTNNPYFFSKKVADTKIFMLIF